MRGANALMFRALDAVIIIGRDTERLLLRYGGVTPDKIRFIPNWATLAPGVRPIRARQSAIAACTPRASWSAFPAISVLPMIPLIVFEAARLLRDDPDIHFLLSGWGIGFERLKADAIRSQICQM